MIKNKKSKLFIYFNVIGLLFTIVHILSMLFNFKILQEFLNIWVQLGLSVVLIVGVGWHFIYSAYKSLIITKTLTMDTLVAIGIILSMFLSIVEMIRGTNQVFFEVTISLIAFINIGRIIENFIKDYSSSNISKIENLQPKFVYKNGQKINIDDISINDIISVKANEIIPLNGVLISKNAKIDASNITGESLTLSLKSNDELISGAKVLEQEILMKVTTTLENSALSKIIESIYLSQFEAPQIQKTVDRVANIFVPVIILMSLVTFIVYMFLTKDFYLSFKVALAIVIISCPCAMGLATPLSVLIGVLRGQKQGIIFKSNATFEKFKQADTFIFDKTGTLTQNKAVVINELSKMSDEQINKVVQIEKQSQHPLGKAVANYYKQHQVIETLDIEKIPGFGVKYKNLIICNEDYINENNIICDDEIKNKVKSWFGTLVWIVENNRVINVLSISDALKVDAIETITQLQKRNKKVYIISGDRKEEVYRIGKLLNIDKENLFYSIKPEEKKNIVLKLKKENKTVSFVGDGINDISAISVADFGISFSHGNVDSVNNSDITLVNDNLSNLTAALNLTTKTISNIKLNVFWAFAYNVFAIPLAMFNYINPMYSAIFMSASSIIVCLNSLRLFKTKI